MKKIYVWAAIALLDFLMILFVVGAMEWNRISFKLGTILCVLLLLFMFVCAVKTRYKGQNDTRKRDK